MRSILCKCTPPAIATCVCLASSPLGAATLTSLVEHLSMAPDRPALPIRPGDPKDLPALSRLVPETSYADGVGAIHIDLPNPRRLSEALSVPANREIDPVPMNNLAVVAHQFWSSHSIAKTPVDAAEPAPIALLGPADASAPKDPLKEKGLSQLAFSRSVFSNGSGVSTPRKQANEVSPAWESSAVYGTFAGEQAPLLADDFATTGKMKTGPGGGLPFIDGRPKAGDARADENVNLLNFHGLFLREHNRLAEDVRAAAPHLPGPKIFEVAQTLNANLQYQIVYGELVPTLLGPGPLESYLPPKVQPPFEENVFTEFSTVAGRLGHTQVPETILVADTDGKPKREVPLSQCFFAPDCLGDATEIEKLLGAALQPAEAIDLFVVPSLQDLLVLGPKPEESFGSDLFAINIQRGRDHGIPGYLDLRAALGFDTTQLTTLLPKPVLDAYGIDADMIDASDLPFIDPLIGLFGEKRATPLDFLGETGKALWAIQFLALSEAVPSAPDGMAQLLLETWRSEQSMADLLMRDAAALGQPFDAALLGRNVFLADVPLNTAASVPVPPAIVAMALGLASLLMLRGRRRIG